MEQLHQAAGATPQFPLSTTDGHLTAAANPTPTHPSIAPSHPSYAEMITAAILWDSSQGKAGGSSKRAIAKYIDRVYTNLPPTHSALLTHHLKRLKNSGQLVMIRNSYQLPVVAATSSPAATAAPVPLRSAPPLPPSPQPSESASLTPKKRPGRPAKAKPLAQPTAATLTPPPPSAASAWVGNGSSTGKRPRGRPPRQQQQQPVVAEVPFVQPSSQPESEAQPVHTPDLGMSNGQSTKRRPGRPPRKQQPAAQSAPAEFQATEQGLVVVPVNGSVSGGTKRRPGRPPKAYVVAVPTSPAVVSPRPRGRPKRYALGPAARPIGKKPRGRPPRQAGIALKGGVAGGKRRGRPPKGSVPLGGAFKPLRKYAGKPRGRPRKSASSAGKQTSEQVAANEALMRRVENMQAIIGDAVSVLRPYIGDENATEALTALQQLENLSTMNLTVTPLPIEPPVTAMSVNATVQVEPSTSVPAPESTIAPPPPDSMTMLSNMMGPPVVPFSITAPTMTETAPLYNVPSTMESQQPASWMPSSEAEL